MYKQPVLSESSVQERVWEACQTGELELVNELLNSPDHKKNVDSWFHPDFKQNALHIAALHGHSEVVKALITDHGVNPNTQTNKLKKTALHLACDECHQSVILVLLENGADPNLLMWNQQTPLHRAALWGNSTILRYLIDHKSDPNKQDENGNTALHLAANNGRPTMIQVLIESGMDVSLKNKKGKTACAVAEEKGYYVSQMYLDRSLQKSQDSHHRTWLPNIKDLVTGKSSSLKAVKVSDDRTSQKAHIGLGKYSMSSFPRGYCIIINNIDFKVDYLSRRDGSDKDATALKQVFGDLLGFCCHVKNNLTAQQIKEMLAVFRDADHSNYSCLVVAVLSHGDCSGILGVDGESVSVEKITSYFVASECQELVNKPKIFIFQACRGSQRETAHCVAADCKDVSSVKEDAPSGKRVSEKEEYGTRDSYFKMVPDMADCVLAYSTMPGFVSYRNNESGSWFIQHLADTLKRLAETESFLDILTEVNRLVALETSDELEVQIPSPQFSLRYKLFFPVCKKQKRSQVAGEVKQQSTPAPTSKEEESQLVCK